MKEAYRPIEIGFSHLISHQFFVPLFETGYVDNPLRVVLVEFDVRKRGYRCASSRIKYRYRIEVALGSLIQ